MKDDRREKTFGSITKDPVVICSPEGAAYFVSENRRLMCLVRHGQTDWNVEKRLQGREHVPLNEEGKEQSRRCAEVLKEAMDLGLDIGNAYTSPLERSAETADIITEALGLSPAIREELLIERDYGSLSGLTIEARKSLFKDAKKAGVEPMPATGARGKQALVKLLDDRTGGATLVVTHGGVLNAMFSCLTGGRIGTGKNISENCAVSLVAVGKDHTVPLAYGLTKDLFLEYIKRYIDKLEMINKSEN